MERGGTAWGAAARSSKVASVARTGQPAPRQPSVWASGRPGAAGTVHKQARLRSPDTWGAGVDTQAIRQTATCRQVDCRMSRGRGGGAGQGSGRGSRSCGGSGQWGHLWEGRFCRRDRRRQVPEGAQDSREAGRAGRGEVRGVTGTRAPGAEATRASETPAFPEGAGDVSDL